MRSLLLIVILLFLHGCAQKDLTKRVVADMVINYYTPYSSVDILVPQSIDVFWIKKSGKKAQAKVCYQFRFLTDYHALVTYIKKNPNSHFAKFDLGLVALLGRKFGDFKKNEIKSRCDIATFEKKYNKWVLRSL
ncbi:hypothetical protein [Nitratiruptor sp. YY09-18]|uniref:hypothetical protein n=1 Tax=Nitratiruptor sp. YY09-18 TaxID=2724901 RepID=UPI0019163CAB|nr:hypothetical protein [Nitratiruptor sp. YY09-18]BCD68437.1 hypothetical protein NitYY0918_C1352 [Nitratiruptor sp. YY09-18]